MPSFKMAMINNVNDSLEKEAYLKNCDKTFSGVL